MSDLHLSMEQLLAVRDGDRSEPAFAEAHLHVERCAACRGELDRLHQRTARLRALPALEPARNQLPAVQQRLTVAHRRDLRRTWGRVGMALAASLTLAVVGRDLTRPSRLDAEAELRTAMSQSQLLEQRLHDWNPDARVLNGHAAEMVVELEDRIAELDGKLAQTARLDAKDRLDQQVKLWNERVGLMNALVDVHVTKASNVGL